MERAGASKGSFSERFAGFLARYGNRKLAIATHSRADPDGISSAFALGRLLPGSVICSADEPTEAGAMLAGKLGMEIRQLSELLKKDFEGLVVVDTSAYTLLPEARGWKILLIIDHHQADGRDMRGEFEIIDSDAPSSAEITAGILPEIDKESAFGLAVGIIADAARFKSARAQTFETLARLMGRWKLDYSELLGYAQPEPKNEAKIAMLKAMQRVNFIYGGGYVIATSEVGSNESDAASLIAEAADVSFIAKWKDREQETRISARASKSCKVRLNKVLAEVGNALGGAGGGHAKAAGAALKAHTDEALKECVETFIRIAEEERIAREKDRE
jgi:nanoRNase/pAp phosphatase (c-di-AMP/oligoRNAs hydrolase)